MLVILMIRVVISFQRKVFALYAAAIFRCRHKEIILDDISYIILYTGWYQLEIIFGHHSIY